jgi:molybdenum cofactor biosynthesis enzyme MoaA
MQNELITYLRDGWYPLEGEGKEHWVWSGQSCSLAFPKNEGGFFLTVSSGLAKICNSPAEISAYDQNNSLLLRESVDFFRKTVLIPASIPTVSMRVSRTWKPASFISGSKDNRNLGICLHRIEAADDYREDCSWLPRTMEIETTSTCNIQPPCVMCPGTGPGPGGEMPDCLIDRIRPFFSDAYSISLAVGGEPLATTQTLALLRMIDSRNAMTSFTTNGLLLTKDIAGRIIDLGLKHIGISFDAATAVTYHKIKGQDFGLLKRNVKTLSQLREKRGSRYPVICLSMVLMNENIHEAPQLVDAAHELGADKVMFQLMNPAHVYRSTQRNGFTFDYAAQYLRLTDENVKKHIRAARDRCVQLSIVFDSQHKELWNV